MASGLRIPAISVIVPATGDHPTLERCLEVIRAQIDEPDELVVVAEPAGEGPAAARNRGAARAGGDVLAFVDSDVVINPDALDRVRIAFGVDPSLTALFGSYDDAPSAPGAVSGFRNLLHHHLHQLGAGQAETFWAGVGAVRRDAFNAVGGFDEETFPRPSIEDVELGLRLAANGARIRLDPALQGKHLKHWTLAEMLHTDFARRGVPWVRLLLERQTVPTHLNLAPRNRLSAAASLLLLISALRRKPRGLLAAGLALVVANLPLYLLIWRRRGGREAVAAPALHALHLLAATASVPAGLVAHVLSHREPEVADRPQGSRPR